MLPQLAKRQLAGRCIYWFEKAWIVWLFPLQVNEILWGGRDTLKNVYPKLLSPAIPIIFCQSLPNNLLLLWQLPIYFNRASSRITFTWRCSRGLHKVILLTPDFDAAILSKQSNKSYRGPSVIWSSWAKKKNRIYTAYESRPVSLYQIKFSGPVGWEGLGCGLRSCGVR